MAEVVGDIVVTGFLGTARSLAEGLDELAIVFGGHHTRFGIADRVLARGAPRHRAGDPALARLDRNGRADPRDQAAVEQLNASQGTIVVDHMDQLAVADDVGVIIDPEHPLVDQAIPAHAGRTDTDRTEAALGKGFVSADRPFGDIATIIGHVHRGGRMNDAVLEGQIARLERLHQGIGHVVLLGIYFGIQAFAARSMTIDVPEI